ncbi:unnamed protein product [Lampetra fluviatilis]
MVVNVRCLKPWRAAPAEENPAARVPRTHGAPTPPGLEGLTRYMGPAGPPAQRRPGPARGRRGRRPLNPSAAEFVPQPAASTVAELDLEEPAVEERAPKLRGLENPAAVSHQWKTSVAQPVQAAAILLAERRARQI